MKCCGFTKLIRCFVGLLMITAAPALSQDEACAGKFRTTVIGGSDSARGMAANGEYLVTVDADSLTVWDQSTPDAPIRVGQWVSAGEGRYYGDHDRVMLDERGFAFVSDSWYYDYLSVEIFDVRDPLHPRAIRRISPDWNDFVLEGDLLVGADDRLDIFDVSDPFRPLLICDGCRDLLTSPPSYTYGAVAVAGDVLVAVQAFGLWVFDLTNPSQPEELFSTQENRIHNSGVRVWAHGDRALITSDSGGMQVMDLTDPSAPVIHDHANPFWDPIWAEFRGRRVFVGDLSGVHCLDLDDPADPMEIPVEIPGVSFAAALNDETLYLERFSGIQMVDVAAEPVEIGEWSSGANVVWFRSDGDLGIVTGSVHVRSLDLSAVGGPVEMDTVTLQGWTSEAAVDGSVIAVPVFEHGVALLTADTDFNLTQVGQISLGSCFARSVDLEAGVLAAGLECDDGTGAVRLFGIADPSHPVDLGVVLADHPVYAVVFEGSRVWATNGGSVLAIDVVDPLSPIIESSVLISEGVGNLLSLARSGECLFTGSTRHTSASQESLLAVVDVSAPAAPVIREVSDEGSFWLAGWNGFVVGGTLWDIFLGRCPEEGEHLSLDHFQLPASSVYSGEVRNGTLFMPARHSIDELDLACVRPEADFFWYPMGTMVQFDDRTTIFDSPYDDYQREWKWTFSNGRTITGNRGPRVDFVLPGLYTVTLEVTTEMGTSVVTKRIAIPREPGLSPGVRQSGGRVAP